LQFGWIVRGLHTGVVTTSYPGRLEPQPLDWRGRPVLDPDACRAADGCVACIEVCLPAALRVEQTAPRRVLVLDYRRCIMCGLCVPVCPAGALEMSPEYELAARRADDLRVSLTWKDTDGVVRASQ